MQISVVVVAHNEERNIGPCLESVLRQAGLEEPPELILVNDSSTDRTVEAARRAAPEVRILENPSRSIAANRNRGFRAASHPYIAYLDADCRAPRHWLATLSAAMERLGVAAVGGANIPPPDHSAHYDALALMLDSNLGSRGSVQGRVFEDERRVAHLPGLNVLFDRRALETVGGWDERFARIGEDEDLSHRLRAHGFELVYVPGAALIHLQRSDLRAWGKNMFTYGKGRMWLLRRHPREWQPSLMIPPLLPALLWAYLPAIAALSLLRAASARRLDLWGHLFGLYAVTHVAYGLGQWRGFFSAGDSEQARRPRRRIAVIADASSLDREENTEAISARLLEEGGEACDFYLSLAGEGLDPRPITPSEETLRGQLRALARGRRLREVTAPTRILRRLWCLFQLHGLLILGEAGCPAPIAWGARILRLPVLRLRAAEEVPAALASILARPPSADSPVDERQAEQEGSEDRL